jgi:glycosyltransferase involved in cell wall biosynthesis
VRVARLVERLPPAVGGKEVHAAELTAALAARGIEQHVFARAGVAPQGAALHRMAGRGSPVTGRVRLLRYCAWVIAAVLREHRRQRFDLLHVHGDFPEAMTGAVLSRALGVPMLLTVHGGLVRRWWHDVARLAAFSTCELVWTVSQEIAETLRAAGVSCEVVVRPSAVREEFFVVGDAHEHREGIVTVGRLAPVKGLEHFVAARDQLAKQVTTTWTVIADGTGPYAEAIRTEIARRPDMTCREEHDPAALAKTVASSAVFVLSSVTLERQHEGVPTALMEAMAAGVPIIASAGGGIDVLLDRGRLGLLVPPGDADALARAILEVLNDPAAARERAAAARQQAVRWSEVAAEVEAGYRRALARHGRSAALVVVPWLTTGGAERFVLRLASALRLRGVRVSVAAAPGELVAELPDGVEFTPLRRGRGFRALGHNALALAGATARMRPVAVNAHSYLSSLSAWAGLGLAGRRARRVLTVHVPEELWYSRVIGASAPVMCSRVLPVAESVRNELASTTPRMLKGRLVTVHAGVERPPDSAGHATNVVVVARMVPRKGHHTILAAWAEVIRHPALAKWVLELWGDGPVRDALESQADRLGLGERVRFRGVVDHASERLGGVGLLALPSRREGLPLVLVEGMMAGAPVVGSDIPGVRELLSGGAGMLVPPDRPTAWAKALVSLLQDDDRRKALGEAGRRRVAWAFAAGRSEAAYLVELGFMQEWWLHEARDATRDRMSAGLEEGSPAGSDASREPEHGVGDE